jgi:hypothetical protein
VGKYLRLLVRNNGYILEQVFSPIVVLGQEFLDELRPIARRCITRHHYHHYRGFYATQRKLIEKEEPKRAKPVLYAYRVLMTGLHLLRSGEVEAPLSEAFTFSLYARGGVRLWIDGVQRIFAWNETVNRWESEPIQLAAGRRCPVQLDFYATCEHPACSLNWESPSLDRRRIATELLYPQTDAAVSGQPDSRPATVRLDARTFDVQSGDLGPRNVRGGVVSGLRQRGLGKSGAYLGFRRIDFGEGVDRLKVRAEGHPAGDASFPVTLEFRVGGPQGPKIAVIALKGTDSGPEPSSVDIESVEGVHDLYIVNTTENRWHFIKLWWFDFD